MNTSADQEKRERSETNSAPTACTGRNVVVVGDKIDSRDLFSGTREIIIGHGSDVYRLRLTAQNKLILTK